MASPLADLDELILECRDQKAKSYIQEAVSSYKVGAFRSAIVSTWIAVAFDIIEKIRELALTGDKEAEKQINEFDKVRTSGDVANALNFEKALLTIARDKLEFISHIEFIDLERLQQDRNRCAHPSMTSEGEAFNPSAELARLHIRSAVTHLLQYPPAQGKYALDRLIAEISSDYFPANENDALAAFKKGPLKRPRDSLVRNFIIVLLKKLLKEEVDYKERKKLISALQAIEKMHPQIFSTTLEQKLSNVIVKDTDKGLWATINFLIGYPNTWDYVEENIIIMIRNFVENLPGQYIDDIDSILDFNHLKDQAEIRLNKITKNELKGMVFFVMHPKIADRIVNYYLKSGSYAEANSWSEIIISNASTLNPDQIKKIISNIANNGELVNSFELPNVINALRARKKIPLSEFELLLENNELGHLMLQDE